MVMVHAMNQNLLSLVQRELKKLIEEFSRVNSKLALQSKRRSQVEETVAVFEDQPFCKRARLDEHDPEEEKLQKSNNTSKEEIEMIITKLVSVEKVLNEGLASTSIKVKEMEQGFAKTSDKLVQMQQGFPKTDDKVEQLEQWFTNTDDPVKQLERDVFSQNKKENKSGMLLCDTPINKFIIKL